MHFDLTSLSKPKKRRKERRAFNCFGDIKLRQVNLPKTLDIPINFTLSLVFLK
jgi:hypothetical protein